MFADVLVPVDGSESGAVDHAVSVAATYGATLHALSIREGGVETDTGDDRRTAREGADPAFEYVEHRCNGENVPVVRAVGSGDRANAVLRYAESAGVDLVVVGGQHRGRVSRLLGAGVAERVSAGATAPVLVVPKGAAARPPYRRLLLATDGQAGSRRAETCAFDLARAYGAGLHVLYVVDSRFGESGALHNLLDREAASVGRDLRSRAARAGAEVTVAVREGRPGTEILDYAGANDVDLIVVGTQGRAGIERVLMGSVARRVLDGASVPVLTARVLQSGPRAGS